MTRTDELEEVREDLEVLLIDVLTSVLSEEAYVCDDDLPHGVIATSRLAIHDESDDSYLGLEIRVGAVLARLMASRMLSIGDTSPEDMLDAVGEFGNIVGGNVKTLLFQTARLSLPLAELAEGAATPPVGSFIVRAAVLGQVAELALIPDPSHADFYWPTSSVAQAPVEQAPSEQAPSEQTAVDKTLETQP